MRNAYDALDRIQQRWDDADREGTQITWSYDSADACNPGECSNPAAKLTRLDFPLIAAGEVMRGSRRIGYDNRNNVIFEAQSWGGVDLAVSTRVNNQNEPVERTYPDGTSEAIALDGVGRISRIASILDEVRYTPRGLLGGLEYHNGATMEMSYDAMLRPETLVHADATGKALESFVYTRDRQGNIIGIADQTEAADIPDATHTLGYDAWYRLTGADLTAASGEAESVSYVFDELDNVVSLTSSLGDASPSHVGAIAYDAERPNTVTQAGALAYTHDPAGHMTQRGGLAMQWDYQMRMSEVAKDGASSAYLYAEGPRQVATVGEDTIDLYGPASFEVRDGVGVTTFRLDGRRVATTRTTALMTSIYPDLVEDGEINAADAFAMATGGAEGAAGMAAAADPKRILGASAARMLAELEDPTTYLHANHLGSLTIATDEGGVVRGQRSFYPTGALRWSEGYVDAYGFTGQEHMDSGLVRFLFRHLDPRIGRWASFDPAFMALTVEQMERFGEATTGYAYVANNFLNSVDPLGLNLKKTKSQGSGRGSKRLSANLKASDKTKAPTPATGVKPPGTNTNAPAGAGPGGQNASNTALPSASQRLSVQSAVSTTPPNLGDIKGGGNLSSLQASVQQLQKTVKDNQSNNKTLLKQATQASTFAKLSAGLAVFGFMADVTSFVQFDRDN